jgi:crossover junction endodeoxyribonuclease RuvC
VTVKHDAKRITRVVGIDPGLAACGIGDVDFFDQQRRPHLLETVRTSPSDPLAARLHTIWRRVGAVITASGRPAPAVMAVEAQARAQAGARERGTASYESQAVRDVMGILRALAWQHGLVLVEVEPATWKSCFGLPVTADKAQVQRAVRALLGWTGRLSEHAADSAGIALAGARYFRSYAAAARK